MYLLKNSQSGKRQQSSCFFRELVPYTAQTLYIPCGRLFCTLCCFISEHFQLISSTTNIPSSLPPTNQLTFLCETLHLFILHHPPLPTLSPPTLVSAKWMPCSCVWILIYPPKKGANHQLAAKRHDSHLSSQQVNTWHYFGWLQHTTNTKSQTDVLINRS